MATKQYEYFGNQSPLMNNRYNQARLNAQRTANVKAEQANYVTDPWFTLGSAIGQAWGDRFNERGISKARGEMNDALSGYLGQFAQQPKTDIEKGGVLNNAMPGAMPSEEMLNNNSAQIQGGVLGGLENAIAPMTPQDAYKQYKNDAWVGKYRGADPNPDGSAITVKNDAQQMNQLADTVDYGKVDKEQAREYVRKQLEQNGRTPYQIEQVLGQFDSIYDSKYGKWKQAKATDLVAKGRKALEDGNYELAMTNFAAAGEYDSKVASPLMQVANNSWQRKLQGDQYNMSKQIELAKNGLMLDQTGKVVRDPNHPVWNTLKYNRGPGGSNPAVLGNVDGSPYTLDMYKADIDFLKMAQSVDTSTDEGKRINEIAKRVEARVLQLGLGVKFEKTPIGNGEQKGGEQTKKEGIGWLTGSDLNQDDDNYDKDYNYTFDSGDYATDIKNGVDPNLAARRRNERFLKKAEEAGVDISRFR